MVIPGSKPSLKRTAKRIFIGIPVDGHAQQKIDDVLTPIRSSRQDIRWVPGVNRHLTLAFLGNLQMSQLNRLSGQFAEFYQQENSFRYRLTSLEPFPGADSTIIALTGEADRSLGQLFQTTSELLSACRLEADKKRFLAHVTVGRLKRGSRDFAPVHRKVNIYLEVKNVSLYQSISSDSGPVYTRLKNARLL